MRFFCLKLKHLQAQRIEIGKTNIKQLNFSIQFISSLLFLLFHIVLVFYYTKNKNMKNLIFYLFDI